MGDDMKSPRRYSREEMSTIFQRALESQASHSASESPEPEADPGFTLPEMEQIAGEVGIDPERLRAAATDLDLERETDRGFRLIGGPTQIHLERMVAGEVSEEVWEEMVGELRRSQGFGQPAQWGRSLEWTQREEGLLTHITVTAREGQTRIQLMAQWPIAPLPFFLPALVLGLISIGIIGEGTALAPLLKAGIVMGLFGGLFGLARVLFGRWSRRRQRRYKALLDRLEALIPKPEETPSATPRLSAEEEEPETLYQQTTST